MKKILATETDKSIVGSIQTLKFNKKRSLNLCHSGLSMGKGSRWKVLIDSKSKVMLI
jgi:hypothetical protein